MKRSKISLLLVVFLMLAMVAGTVSAQTDPDGDNVFGNKDKCPNAAGPASNAGCPLPQDTTQEQPLHPPGDSDGDGTLDEADKCPLDGGPSWNNGCPTDLTAPPQTGQSSVLPTMPTTGPCVIATAGQDSVNSRSMPGATSSIIAVLRPADLYPAFAIFTDDSGVWYLTRNGWSSGQVLRLGVNCDTLPSFDFGDVQLNLADGPGDGLILNFLPVPGGKPFVDLHPFAPSGTPIALNFTKTGDGFPDTGFSFLLMPFPSTGSSDNAREAAAEPLASDVFDDGYLRSQMGDGSVFIMRPGLRVGANGIIAILIGLLRSENDPNGILIGLNQPSFDPTKILIGLNQPDSVNGDTQGNSYAILIGLLLPAVQTGEANPAGILIGLLQPSQVNGDNEQFGFGNEPFVEGGGTEAHPGGANVDPGAQVSVQKVRQMGLDLLVPSAGAPASNLFTAGWGVNVQGLGTVSSN